MVCAVMVLQAVGISKCYITESTAMFLTTVRYGVFKHALFDAGLVPTYLTLVHDPFWGVECHSLVKVIPMVTGIIGYKRSDSMGSPVSDTIV